MKTIILILAVVILFLTFGCPGNKVKNKDTKQIENQEWTDLTGMDYSKTQNVDSVVSSGKPCDELQEFVVEIESLNWVSDTGRLNKTGIYSELNRDGIKYFNGRPFYHISFKDSRLNQVSAIEHFESFDFELFKGVKNIWGYFYRDKNATDWISDGVIEQWEFENEIKAQKALVQIKQSGSIIYFNTNPYFCRIENKLFIFQSRAMAFSYDQEPVFDKFVTEYR